MGYSINLIRHIGCKSLMCLIFVQFYIIIAKAGYPKLISRKSCILLPDIIQLAFGPY